MKEKISVMSFFVILFILVSNPALAILNQIIRINGTAYLKTTYDNGEEVLQEIINVNGTAYINMTINTGTNRLRKLENYITSNDEEWSSDSKGTSMEDVAEVFEEVANYKTGKTKQLDGIEKAILNAINKIIYTEIIEQLEKNVNPTLDAFSKRIQDNIYSLEAISNTLEITSPEEFCEMKREILKKYNLGKVKCGLSSKICYNGEKYPYEDGRDYCIYDDKNATCYLNGGCGHLKEIKALNSETNSLGIFNLKFENDGIYKVPLIFEAKINGKKIQKDLGKVKPGKVEKEILWNTSGLNPGEYSAKVSVIAGPKEIIDYISFKLFPYGSIPREGEISYLDLIQESQNDKSVNIVANYTNFGYPTSVRMNGKVYLDGNLTDTFETEKQFLKRGEFTTFSTPYNFRKFGKYEIYVKIGEADKRISFNLKKGGIAGYIIKNRGSMGFLIIIAIILLAILLLKSNPVKKFNYKPIKNKVSKKIFKESFRNWKENNKPILGKKTYLSEDNNKWVMFYNDYHDFNDVNLENGSIRIKNKRIYPSKNFSKYLEKGKGLKFHVGVSPNKNIPEGKWYFQGLNILTEGKLKGDRGNEYLFGKFNGNKGIMAAWEDNQIGVIKNPCVRNLSGGNGKKRFYLSGKEVPVINFEKNGKDLDVEVKIKPLDESLAEFKLNVVQGKRNLGEIQGEVDLKKIGGIIGINSIAEGRFKDFQVSILN